MSDPFLGEIRALAFNFVPPGWALCDGQLLSIAQNTALFALLGTTYGGNGTTDYALPTIPGLPTKEESVAVNYCIAIQGIFPQRE